MINLAAMPMINPRSTAEVESGAVIYGRAMWPKQKRMEFDALLLARQLAIDQQNEAGSQRTRKFATRQLLGLTAYMQLITVPFSAVLQLLLGSCHMPPPGTSISSSWHHKYV
jgi:hypothetical protein